jgi:hypothetical protein
MYDSNVPHVIGSKSLPITYIEHTNVEIIVTHPSASSIPSTSSQYYQLKIILLLTLSFAYE